MTPGGPLPHFPRPAQVLLVSGVMFRFISFWRTAAVVLCDLASTSFYIGSIAELSIGKAAPWFILAVLFFSYAVRWVYIESCTLFVRGGIYRVVRDALGRFPAKIAVGVLMFDYVLTGPISGVCAGQYLIGWILELIGHVSGQPVDPETADLGKRLGAMILASGITLFFYRQNLRGVHETSGRALKVVLITAGMGVLVIVWGLVTLALRPDTGAWPPTQPDFAARLNPDTQQLDDPLGLLSQTSLGEALRGASTEEGFSWLSAIGLVGLMIAFGHSILAMSGQETLAQVYREVESPKLRNFKRAALVVFAFSLTLTASLSFLAVSLIPDDVRLARFSGNLIGGLAMHVLGPPEARLVLHGLVVGVALLILAGAVNTSLVGSNGLLNRVAEDGFLTGWFLKPHRTYGTTHRLLGLIVGLQLLAILLSRGNLLGLGEAYAFGVLWSFVFQALSIVVLRFRDHRPREYKVPFNIPVGGTEIPVGLLAILGVLLTAALLSLMTKEIASLCGILFTGSFVALFWHSGRSQARAQSGTPTAPHEHFDEQQTQEVTAESFGLTKKYRKLVSIRSTHNLIMLEKALIETDPETTGVVVMTAKVLPEGGAMPERLDLDTYDRHLLTVVVRIAEQVGKQVCPLVVPTNNPLHAVMKTAKDLQAHELIVGASNKYTADEQLEQLAFYWISLHDGRPAPLTVRVLGRDRDMALDLGGGNRIPKISERQARSVAELRAAGVGVDRVLMLHDGTPAASDLFQSVLTMLDPAVVLDLVPVVPVGREPLNGHSTIHQDTDRGCQLGRTMTLYEVGDDVVGEVVALARAHKYNLIVVPLTAEISTDRHEPVDQRAREILRRAHCPVFLAAAPPIPDEVVDRDLGG